MTVEHAEALRAEDLRAHLDRGHETIRQLQHALRSRVIIEQAKGVLAERHGVNVDRSFEVMRRYARNGRRNLHEVAAAIVSGDEDPFVVDLAGQTATARH